MNNLETLICNYCKKTKLIDLFIKAKHIKRGHSKQCKECKAIYEKQYRNNNKEKGRAYKKEWRKKNREKYLISKKKHDFKYRNKPENKERLKQQIKKCNKKRRETDFNFKLRTSLSKRVNMAVRRNNTQKLFRTYELTGCSIEFLKEYLQSLFELGMTWDNYGKGVGKWNIDHIIPCSLFDLTKEDQQLKCFHYTNMRPLWQSENFSKNDYLNNGKRARNLTNEEKQSVLNNYYPNEKLI